MRRFATAAVIAALAAGCADQFAPYSLVQGHRVLGIRATPPELLPGESATLEALVTSDDPERAWSWCPLPFADSGAGECPLDESELRAALQRAGSDADPPPYDLGADASAQFEHSLPPEVLAGLCEALRQQPLPEGVDRPECSGRYEITVRVVASSGSEEITAVRTVGLVYSEDYEPNSNPAIEGARIGVPYFELAAGEPAPVGYGFQYKLEVDVPEENAETYEATSADGEPVARRESLVLSWFREGGSMETNRSSFLEGTTDFENLTTNEWIAPAEDELEGDETRLYFVLRDDRGGIDWLTANLELVE